MVVQKIIEALLFAADAPLTPEQIEILFQQDAFADFSVDTNSLQELLQKIEVKYQSEEYVFELQKINQGWQFLTKPAYHLYLQEAAFIKNKKRLSKTNLETLAIIAYRQPVTKAEIEFIRGVGSDYAIQKLLDKQLIEIIGRAESPGRPLLYGTSSYFMEHFGLQELGDLPKLKELDTEEEAFQQQFDVYINEKQQKSQGGSKE